MDLNLDSTSSQENNLKTNEKNNDKLRPIDKLVNKMKETNFIKRGDFTLKSGIHSSYYVDVKALISYPEIMATLSNLLYIKIINIIRNENLNISQVVLCGLPYAGIPFVSYISMKHNISMILLRKEKKDYGTKKIFEGTLHEKKHLILVDDILTTGKSIIESLDMFSEFNINTSAVVLIDREECDAQKNIFKRLKNIYSVFKLSRFLDI
jgi:uridine monophosphate synthetase